MCRCRLLGIVEAIAVVDVSAAAAEGTVEDLDAKPHRQRMPIETKDQEVPHPDAVPVGELLPPRGEEHVGF